MMKGSKKKGIPYDLIGNTFGKWIVTSYEGVNSNRCHTWKCKCECGKEMIHESRYLNNIKSNKLIGGCRDCKAKRMERVSESRMWEYCKISARNRTKEFNVTREYLFDILKQQDNKCALTGLPILIAIGARNHQHGGTTASIDRIDNNLGYIEGNIQWVHKDINKLKIGRAHV